MDDWLALCQATQDSWHANLTVRVAKLGLRADQEAVSMLLSLQNVLKALLECRYCLVLRHVFEVDLVLADTTEEKGGCCSMPRGDRLDAPSQARDHFLAPGVEGADLLVDFCEDPRFQLGKALRTGAAGDRFDHLDLGWSVYVDL